MQSPGVEDKRIPESPCERGGKLVLLTGLSNAIQECHTAEIQELFHCEFILSIQSAQGLPSWVLCPSSVIKGVG